ncbi:uncharacterized protein N7483_000636 [Penicillium malachiteum]|uniref:uncharacterized protein n=1 Tax=Penicillium malachiteum TaxID=1324776 RepID=UPI002547C24F|nr:uncharacterized protein N7483_000636 [Penicillium malachiteum]KAJ5735511.1 hypothetical protein N7483_000636 [Penicillium malachiteum]
MTNSLVTETFVEYGIGISFLVLRMFARLNFGGIQGLRLDDAFAAAGMVCILDHANKIYGSNIGLTKVTAMEVTDSEMPDMILGSKLAFMNWIWYMSYLWCLKGVFLCLYWKLTYVTRDTNSKAGSGSCDILYTQLASMSIDTYLHMHTNSQELADQALRRRRVYNCTLRQPLYVVIAVLNVISDLMIMIIPFLMLNKLQVAFERKIILGVMFMSGIFIMICTILRCYYSLGDISQLPTALHWADRECFVAAIVASLPGIKPLFRGVGWLGFTSYSRSKNTYGTEGYNKFASGETRHQALALLSAVETTTRRPWN